jgi:ribonuclease BN (tRNA processing enzyme)
VYATDLADTPANRARLIAHARDAAVLICEAPFIEADAGQAARTQHLTARACGEIAAAAGVGRLIPFHFSKRYERQPESVYAEVRAAATGVVVHREDR